MDHTKKRFGKKDAVFLGLLLIIAILIFFFTNYYQKETGAMVTVTVTVDGKVYGNCPDQLCVHQQAISKESQTIVCLPNKVVAEVTGNTKKDYDAVVQ